jgi:hypothetical protein
MTYYGKRTKHSDGNNRLISRPAAETDKFGPN